MSSEQFQQQLNGIMNDMSLQMEESEKVEKEMQAVIGPRDDADVRSGRRRVSGRSFSRQAEASRAQVQKLSKEISCAGEQHGEEAGDGPSAVADGCKRRRAAEGTGVDRWTRGGGDAPGGNSGGCREPTEGCDDGGESRGRSRARGQEARAGAGERACECEQSLRNADGGADRPHEANALREAGVQSDWNLPPREGRVQGMDSGAGDLSGPTACRASSCRRVRATRR